MRRPEEQLPRTVPCPSLRRYKPDQVPGVGIDVSPLSRLRGSPRASLLIPPRDEVCQGKNAGEEEQIFLGAAVRLDSATEEG